MNEVPPDIEQELRNLIKGAVNSAQNAASEAADAKKAATGVAKNQEKVSKLAWGTFVAAAVGVGVAVVAAVISGYQYKLQRSSLEATNEALEATNEASRAIFLRSVQSTDEALHDQYLANKALRSAEILAPDCDRELDLTPAQKDLIQTDGDKTYAAIRGHFEVASIREFAPEWKQICEKQKNFLNEHCHLKLAFDLILERDTTDFKEGYRTCELSME
jgi:hypothetical protein